MQSLASLRNDNQIIHGKFSNSGQNIEELLRLPVQVELFGGSGRHAFFLDRESRGVQEDPAVAVFTPGIKGCCRSIYWNHGSGELQVVLGPFIFQSSKTLG